MTFLEISKTHIYNLVDNNMNVFEFNIFLFIDIITTMRVLFIVSVNKITGKRFALIVIIFW